MLFSNLRGKKRQKSAFSDKYYNFMNSTFFIIKALSLFEIMALIL